jgi:hypothetical protein
MFSLKLTKKSEDKLDFLRKNDKYSFDIILESLIDIQKLSLHTSNIKNI